MKWPLAGVVLLAGVVAFAFWFESGRVAPNLAEPVQTDSADSSIVDQPVTRAPSPFAVDNTVTDSETPIIDAEVATSENSDATAANDRQNQVLPPLDSALSQEQFLTLVRQLKTNPVLLEQLVDMFRQETDPDRKRRMADIIGAVGGEQALLLASELIFSGDSDSRTIGLQLLQEIQPDNDVARDIVSDMLATEVEPRVLVESLSALAKPGKVDQHSRAYLSEQVVWLTSHQNDGVRSVSLDILSRWSNDGSHTDVLLAGLDDRSEYVRSSAAYALANHEDKSPQVIERLMVTLRDSSEIKRVKEAAILALRSLPLSEAQNTELQALEKQLYTVRR